MTELLAPAGGWSQLKAAVNNGADAVYMGGSLFNARIKADNFKGDEMAEAIAFAHDRNVRIYITLNTLIKDSELAKALEYAGFLYEAGADAIIVQDMGLARLVRKYVPDLTMHLSTQGTVYNVQALDLVKEFGFRRVVPARELTLEEIRRMCAYAKAINTEIEVFVHGALCMCYSGQCQMSRNFGGGGRSGNRGLCAQPCRLAYTDEKGKAGYLLSPKDICTLERIPELIEAGVDSFKIEGRLKSAEYVATVTRIYRKYIDMYRACGKVEIDPEDMHDLTQIFNRGGFMTGYLDGNPGDEILSGNSPKNRGIYMGKVSRVSKEIKGRKKVLAEVKTGGASGACGGEIRMGDGVEIRSPKTDVIPVVTGNVVTYVEQLPKGIVRIGDFDKGIREGDEVYKVTDVKLNEKALSAPEKKLPVVMRFHAVIGENPVLEISEKYSADSVKVRGDFAVEKALKKPTDPDRIREQLMRLGDTVFEAAEENVIVDAAEGIMIPVSVLNSMRREAAEKLCEKRREEYASRINPLTEEKLAEIIENEDLGNDEKLAGISSQYSTGNHRETELIPLADFMKNPGGNKGKIPYILNVSKGGIDDYIEADFDAVVKAVSGCGIAVGNPGWIKQFADAGVKVYGDYGLNAYNAQCVKAYEEAGVEVIRLSHETGAADGRFGGKIPLMITEHPLRSGHLTDRKGVKHDVICAGDKYLIL